MTDCTPDLQQVLHFLELLGRNGDTRFRAFPHKLTPPDIKAQLRARKFGRDKTKLLEAQTLGLGVYVVINPGGDSKDSITACVAYFAEFDGIPEDQQLQQVADSGLPDPSIVVRTGGGSLHFYWLLSEPIADTALWQQDMKRLAAHLGSDPSINDPSRVMRLPGCWYMGPDQRPIAKVEIVHESTDRFTRDQLISLLPELPTPSPRTYSPTPSAPALPTSGIPVPLLDFISKAAKELVELGSAAGSNNDDGLKLALELVACHDWIIDRNFKPEPSAEDLYEQYIARSAAHFGPSYDRPAAWRRFEGARAQNPLPATPIHKLEERLAYHQRQYDKQHHTPKYSSLATAHLQHAHDTQDDDLEDDAGLSVAEQLGLSQRLADNRKLFTLEGLLPADLAQALELINRPLPTDPLAASLALLTGYSGLLKLGTFVSSSLTHRVPANLYLALVAPSGVAKTSVKRTLVDDPASDVRRDAAREHQRAMQAWEDENKGKKKNDRSLPPRPVFPHLSDYTPAALSLQLMLNEVRGLGQLITADELSGLLKAIEQDTDKGTGTATAQLLEAFDGSGFTSIRVADSARSYERCHLSIYGNVQPDILRTLINGEDATGKFARFLFCRTPLRPLLLEDDDPTPEQWQALDQAQQLLKDYASRIFRLTPRTYSLSKPARTSFHAWFTRYQEQALAPGASSVIGSLLGKSSAHALRLAGILHILQVVAGNTPSSDLISADTANTAMAVVDQLIDETKAFHEAPETEAALLLRHIHQLSWTSRQSISRQDARNKGSRPIRRLCNANAFDDAIEQLAQLGYGLIELQPTPLSGKSRPNAYRATRPMP